MTLTADAWLYLASFRSVQQAFQYELFVFISSFQPSSRHARSCARIVERLGRFLGWRQGAVFLCFVRRVKAAVSQWGGFPAPSACFHWAQTSWAILAVRAGWSCQLSPFALLSRSAEHISENIMSQVLLEVICSQADICFAVFMCLETLTFSFVLLFPPLSPSSHLFGSRLGW